MHIWLAGRWWELAYGELPPGTKVLRVPTTQTASGSSGRPRTQYRTTEAPGEADAAAQLVSFLDEMRSAQQPSDRSVRDLSVDQAIEIFLTDLGNEKGREPRTINDYRLLHKKWSAPSIGAQRVSRVDTRGMTTRDPMFDFELRHIPTFPPNGFRQRSSS